MIYEDGDAAEKEEAEFEGDGIELLPATKTPSKATRRLPTQRTKRRQIKKGKTCGSTERAAQFEVGTRLAKVSVKLNMPGWILDG